MIDGAGTGRGGRFRGSHPGGGRRVDSLVLVVAVAVAVAVGAAVFYPRIGGQRVVLGAGAAEDEPPGYEQEGIAAAATREGEAAEEPQRDHAGDPLELPPREDWRIPDDLWYAVSLEVPTFAGVIGGGGNTLVVLDTDADIEAAERARALILELAPDGYDYFAGAPLRVERVRFSWRQLYEWYETLWRHHLHEIEGWNLSDIDEAANRIVFGVEDLARHGPSARAAAQRVGIPHEAFQVVAAGPVETSW